MGGDADTLFFTAGLENEQHGLFGAIQPPQILGSGTGGTRGFDPSVPGERSDYPLPPSTGPALSSANDATTLTALLLPVRDASLTLAPTLIAVTQPVARGDASPPSPTAVAVSTAQPVSTGLLAAGTTLLLPAADDSRPPEHTREGVSLNAFLDVSTAPALTGKNGIVQEPGGTAAPPADSGGATDRLDVHDHTAPVQEGRSLGPADEPGATRDEVAADGRAHRRLLQVLTMAAGVPLAWSALQRWNRWRHAIPRHTAVNLARTTVRPQPD